MAVIFLCSLFPDNDGFSPFENRELSGRPELTLGSIFSGKFESGYESYLLDNFLLRNFSVQSYQDYTELFFLDAFKKSEDVLMSVDVDTFVTAKPPADTEEAGMTQGRNDTEQKEAGKRSATSATVERSPEGRESVTAFAQSDRQQTADMRSTTGKAASYQAAVGQGEALSADDRQNDDSSLSGDLKNNVEQDPLQDGVDDRLNNSLIISGDRVMMPTGANNLKAYGSVLTKIAGVLPDKNIYSITGPTSAAYFASEKYSTGSYDQSKAEGIIEASAQGVKVVKAYDMFLGHKDENIYFRSDVHWTALGAYYAYTAFCQSAGLTPASLDADFTKDTYKPFLGGLYSQIYKQPQAARLKNNPEQLDYYIPKIGYQLTLYNTGNLKAPYKVDSIINTNFSSLGAYQYSCFAWGDQRIERIDSDAPGGRKALVVKDSYGSALVPFLVPNYSKIYVIDPKGFNQEGSLSFDAKELIREEEIDDVVLCFSIYGSGRKVIQNGLTDLFLR